MYVKDQDPFIGLTHVKDQDPFIGLTATYFMDEGDLDRHTASVFSSRHINCARNSLKPLTGCYL